MSNLFLTGPSGTGKSTLLTEVLSKSDLAISGFFTQRLLLPDGTTGGFRLLPWSRNLPVSAPYQPDLPDLFIKKDGNGWKKDLTVFETLGLRLLDGLSPASDFICLDEIGGTELLVPAFRRRLYEVLETFPRCTGVIKSPANLSSMLTRVGMKAEESRMLYQLHEDLLHRFNSRIFSVTKDNREQTRELLSSFLDLNIQKEHEEMR